MQRLFITVSDLQKLTDTSERNCQRKMQLIKDALKKEKHQHVTFKEYCNYENIKLDEVYETLGMTKPTKPQ